MGLNNFTEKWRKVKLSDIGQILTGNTPSTKNEEYYNSSDFMFIKPDDFQKNALNNISVSKACISTLGSEKSRKVPAGSVLVTCIGTIGKVALVEKEACFNQQINAIIPDKSMIDSKFLGYAMLKYNYLLKSIANAPIVPIINKTQFSNVEIMIPSLDIQKKIVDVLEKAEKVLEKRKEASGLLDELVKSKFIEMFGDTFLNTKKFEMKQIKDVAKLVKGITYKPEQVDEEGIIVLRSSNIQNSNFDLKDIVRLNKTIDERFLVIPNDILMCNRNGSQRLVGKVAKIPRYEEQMTFGTFMTIVRSPYYNYLFSFFQTEAFRRQIKMQTTVAINQISIPLLESVKVPLPPIEIQNQFTDFVKQIDKLKSEMQKSLEELENNYQSLMQRAFKGELFN